MRTSLDEEPTKIIEEKEEQLQLQLQLVAQPRPTPTIKQFSNLDTIGFEIERESLSEEKVDVLAEKRREKILKVKELSAEEEQRRDDERQKLGNINNAKLFTGSSFPPPPPCQTSRMTPSKVISLCLSYLICNIHFQDIDSFPFQMGSHYQKHKQTLISTFFGKSQC